MVWDVTIIAKKPLKCPKCREVVGYEFIGSECSQGPGWRDWFESIGYYVDYENRTEDNSGLYGDDYMLSDKELNSLMEYVESRSLDNRTEILRLIYMCKAKKYTVLFNADW